MRRDLHQSLPELGPGAAAFRRPPVRSHSLAGQRALERRTPFSSLNTPKASTLRQNYYPEGGWGWIVLGCALILDVASSSVHLSSGFLVPQVRNYFHLEKDSIKPVLIACCPTAVSLFLSPLIVALSKRRSMRLLALFGGFLAALGSLFTSFASKLHQVSLSSGLLGGLGKALASDTSAQIFGQYFKRRRHQVDMIFIGGYGFGIAAIPLLFNFLLRTLGWRHSFQILAGIQTIACFLSVFYRPASLYHPQRRAILHIKSLQRRSKTKDKTSVIKEKKPFFDFSVLKSKTVQVLIFGTAIASFGIHAPFILLIEEMEEDGLDMHSICQLQVSFGLAVAIGALMFGLLVLNKSANCIIAKQYLCQTAILLLSCSFLAYPILNGFYGYVLFIWFYGICYSGYVFSLKSCVFEKVRARNYARTWSFILGSQAIPSIIGISTIYHLNNILGFKRGYYVSSGTAFIGSLSLFYIDFHKKNVKRKKQLKIEKQSELWNPQIQLTNLDEVVQKAQELTCISEEILVDPCLEDYIENCITSCDKEEKFLMLSEFENNLFKTENDIDGSKECDSEKDHDCMLCYSTPGEIPLCKTLRSNNNFENKSEKVKV